MRNHTKTLLFTLIGLLLSGLLYFTITNKDIQDEVISNNTTEIPTKALTETIESTNTTIESNKTPKPTVVKVQSKETVHPHQIKYEERPKVPTLTGREKELFIEYLLSRSTADSGINKIRQNESASSTYANGRISGTWEAKTTRSGWYGYRVDNSTYDSIKNVFYVVSYAGHLYKLDYQDEVKWTLLNHKIQLNPPDNASANPIFDGLHLPDGTFRLFRSNDDAQRMEYSNDEGRTWLNATGANVARSWSNQSVIINSNSQKRIALHTFSNNYHYLYFSDNHGQTYTSSKLSFPISTHDIRIVKPYNTDEISLIVWNKSTKGVTMYQYNHTLKDYELKHTSTSTIVGSNLSNFEATYHNGQYHYYISSINSTYTVYYSADQGLTWQQKHAGRDKPFELLIHNKPNVLMSGFEDIRTSTDFGANWNGFGYNLGWDLQHIKTFKKADGKHITLVGLDFGCYISETPDIKTSYKWCNDKASYAMHYDAASSENFNTVYLANQDRGSTSYLDTGKEVSTRDVDGTDVLRVAYSNHESSVWSWFYYGRIRHRHNFPTGQTATAIYDGLGNWWAAPIVASPIAGENAIYAAYGNNLEIFSYVESTNTIAKKSHPFNFNTAFGDKIGGFGYSELNRNIWYVALNNGTFLYSKNAGNTWTKSIWGGSKPRANDQSYNYAKNQIVIRASENDTNKVYYAGVGNMLLISADAGRTFSVKNSGLNVFRIRDFVVTPDDKFVFAACGYNGVWIFSVEDNKWYQMNDSNIPSVDFTDVDFIRTKNIVRFATYGSGVIDFKLNEVVSVVSTPSELKAKTEANKYVRLTWNEKATDEDGYYVERATDADFIRIDTLPANTNSYLDTNIVYGATQYYIVKAFKGTLNSGKSNTATIDVPKKGVIDNSTISIVGFSSQETVGSNTPAVYAIDNNINTFWHTSWQDSQPNHPHYIVFDLGSESQVAGIRYLPRQDGKTEGNIANFELFITNDTLNWGEPALSGKFSSGKVLKESLLSQPITGRYVKLLTLSSIVGDKFANAAEISIMYEAVVPDKPTNLFLGASSDNIIMLRWTDNSINETGFKIQQLINDKFVQIDTVKANTTYYSHRNLLPGTKNTYRIVAYNNVGLSEPTNILATSTTGQTSVPKLSVNFKIYPNPCIDELSVEFDALSTTATFSLIDSKGKIVLSETISAGNNKLKFNITHLPKGTYFAQLKTDKGSIVNKIIKQ